MIGSSRKNRRVKMPAKNSKKLAKSKKLKRVTTLKKGAGNA